MAAGFLAGEVSLDNIAEVINQRLAGKEMRVKVVVEDLAGNEIVIQPVPVAVRWGETVDIRVKLGLEVQ